MFKHKIFYHVEDDTHGFLFLDSSVVDACKKENINIYQTTLTDLLMLLQQSQVNVEKEIDEIVSMLLFLSRNILNINREDVRICLVNSKISLEKLIAYRIKQEKSHEIGFLFNELSRYYLDECHFDVPEYIVSLSHLFILVNCYMYMKYHMRYVLHMYVDTQCQEYDDEQFTWFTNRHSFHMCSVCEILGNIKKTDGEPYVEYEYFKQLDEMCGEEAEERWKCIS